MSTITFDTMALAEKLEQSGFDHRQAKAIVEAVLSTREETATKQDIADVRRDLSHLATKAELSDAKDAIIMMSIWAVSASVVLIGALILLLH